MRTTLLTASAALAAALAACGPAPAQPGQAGAPVESRAPNSPDQKPAFAGQTRAPGLVSGVSGQYQTLASGLEHPWGMAFLPSGEILVTERAGRLRVVGKDGKLSPAVTGLPAIYAEGQGGLLGVTLDPDYAKNGLVYWAYAEEIDSVNGTAVARGKLTLGAAPKVENVQVIWRQTPKMASPCTLADAWSSTAPANSSSPRANAPTLRAGSNPRTWTARWARWSGSTPTARSPATTRS